MERLAEVLQPNASAELHQFSYDVSDLKKVFSDARELVLIGFLEWLLRTRYGKGSAEPLIAVGGGAFDLSGVDDSIERALRQLGSMRIDLRLKGLFADVLWIQRRDYVSARTVVDAYYEVFLQGFSSPNQGVSTLGLLIRAFAVGSTVRYQDGVSLLRKALFASFEALRELPGWRLIELSKSVVEHSLLKTPEDLRLVLSWCRKLAVQGRIGGELERPVEYLEVALAISRKLQDRELEDSVGGELFDAKHAYTREFVKQNPIAASRAYAELVSLCDSVPSRRERYDEVYLEMREAQKHSLNFMEPIPVPVEIIARQEEFVGQVSGLSFEERINFLTGLLSEKAIKSYIHVDEVPLFVALSGAGVVQSVSETVDGRISSMSDDHHSAEFQYRVFLLSTHINRIGAIADQLQIGLWREPSVADDFVRDVVRRSGLVPESRFEKFVGGILAGMSGDVEYCAHLLPPQLEHALRNFAERSGLRTDYLKRGRTVQQYSFDMNNLLKGNENFRNLIGGEYSDLFRVLLVDESGVNLRNNVAHGLLDELNPAHVHALWVATLALCLSFAKRP